MNTKLCVCLAILPLVLGCATPSRSYHSYYTRAMYTVRQPDKPSPTEVERALADLERAGIMAQEQLAKDGLLSTPSYHDQVAYIIPLSRLAKAEIFGRFHQLPQQEQECWQAIQDAETYLGEHIRRLQGNTNPYVLFTSYAVFFRREKMRRYAFTLLRESYRQAGERDLEELMGAQIGLSDIYLRSSVAHSEEEYIRMVENADWIRRGDDIHEGIRHGFMMVVLFIGVVLSQASYEAERVSLERQYERTSDPHMQAELRRRMDAVSYEQQRDWERHMAYIDSERQHHDFNVGAIASTYYYTVTGALLNNFELLRLSEEVRQLPEYQTLRDAQEQFDNYARRSGLNREAAAALGRVRVALDELTRKLQRRTHGVDRLERRQFPSGEGYPGPDAQ